MRVLLVDDDDDVREYTAQVLEEAGLKVSTARCAPEAEAWLAGGERVDLLITDIVMPGPDGVELARRFHALRPAAKILFTTGYTRHIAPDLLAGAEILDKPYAPEALLHAVRHLLQDCSSTTP